MVVQLCARRNGSEVCGIGKRRHFVTKVRTGNHGARHQRKRRAHACRNTHQRHTDGSCGPPGGTGTQGYHCRYQERGHCNVAGADNFQSVIYHHGDGAANHPGTNQKTYNNQNENSGHCLGKLAYDGIHDIIPGISQSHGNHCRHRCGNKHQYLRA